MRRDFKVAILLAGAAIPIGLALMAAPLYFDIPKIFLAVCFWSGLVAAALLFLAAIAIALRDEESARRRGHKKLMYPIVGMILSGIGFLVSAGVYFWPDRNTAIVWTFGDLPHPIVQSHGDGNGHSIINWFQVTGTNASNDPITNLDGFLRSNLTNEQYPLYFRINGKYVRTIDTNGIPPHSDFIIFAPLTKGPDFQAVEMSESEFLAEFGDVTLQVSYNGQGSPFTHHFDKNEIWFPIEAANRSLRESASGPPEITKKTH